MAGRIQDKVAIVMGAAQGIGAGMAERLVAEGGKPWMGFRPSMPDSLPVIGRSPHARRVIYAFGHGHLGLTQSAGTAELVADLADSAEPGLDLEPLAAERFVRRVPSFPHRDITKMALMPQPIG